ncbi:diaminobutyrate--2-oxoglutarate transaminase [Mycobacterium talmoniae]|uniref:Diaminobutyrate--2-oxoglutarate transaminase n=1 Tax=Mycobacterium talmoniae TaxID=1858794 RepID=A0A1S1NNJ7_9MYCO|nr:MULTISPECIES: diaminobutyrate--2-oxoglutarate transaminase [Mycobacterium]OHV05720.1 diaminobutyrate--2-oxoglutarate transaminase [Mycobacterium talmoniae]PQM47053.1 Diaminobutyrate--2-oxoglutarate transaminase [Mycobacterium talmoniae]TDH56591.1 diaminobutyrate--2-oxoglutarate transaminase [Mycobacterium eburneum]
MTIFETLESEVRSYCRSWPVVFDRAAGAHIWDTDGRQYLDFFAGAGALNYGHNHPDLKAPLLEYLTADRVVHSLDMNTVAKAEFLERFEEVILKPRGLDYKVQFPGPTGTNSVESALKLARKITGRESVISFTNAFHGMTLGSLSVTGNSMKRGGAGIPLVHATPMPYDNYLDGAVPDFIWFERLLEDSGSGLNDPAAVIVETVQGEGGVNVARLEWLKGLAELCRRHELLLIVDDVQMGCGRTGPFFSFEAAGIVPDIVCMSKSISGYGLPLALTLFKSEHDVWEPGEHNGTFRGQNPSFVTGKAALNFWTDNSLEKQVMRKGELVERALREVVDPLDGVETRGRGLIRGVAFDRPELADAVCKEAFSRGLLLETSGPESEVVKLMPPLVIEEEDLARGLTITAESIEAVAGRELAGAAGRSS